MSQNNPLISIVIPTYNGEFYIEETLNNILLSEYKNFEILCVDDLSTDCTCKSQYILASFCLF